MIRPAGTVPVSILSKRATRSREPPGVGKTGQFPSADWCVLLSIRRRRLLDVLSEGREGHMAERVVRVDGRTGCD